MQVVDSIRPLPLKPLYFRESVGTSDIIHFAQNRVYFLPCRIREALWFNLAVALKEGKEYYSFNMIHLVEVGTWYQSDKRLRSPAPRTLATTRSVQFASSQNAIQPLCYSAAWGKSFSFEFLFLFFTLLVMLKFRSYILGIS